MAPSPSRRKSIAVPQHGSSLRPSHRRRPHSITPGDAVLKQLSPAARRRRSLAPRKSILKLAIPDNTDDTVSQDDASSSANTMLSRKSLNRRISFAEDVTVMLFRPRARERRSSRLDQQPSQAEEEPDGEEHDDPQNEEQPPPPAHQTDENDYPGASKSRRRSSLRRRSAAFSENGEADMDMVSEYGEDEDDYNVTMDSSPLPPGFLDEHPEEDDEGDEEDMELDSSPVKRTTISGRRSSLAARPPLAEVSRTDPPDVQQGEQDQSYSMSVDDSMNSADISTSTEEPMEYTMPLNKSLRKSHPPSQEWLQLQAMTHAGIQGPEQEQDEESFEDHTHISVRSDEDMDLTEAQTRLYAARQSLVAEQALPEHRDDTLTSSEGDSAEFGFDNTNETVNLTNVFRDSIGGRTDASSEMNLTDVQLPIDDFDEPATEPPPTSSPSPEPSQAEPSSSEQRKTTPPPPAPMPPSAPAPNLLSPSKNPPPTPQTRFRSSVFSAPSASTSSRPPHSPFKPVRPSPQPVFAKPGPVFSAPKPTSPRKGGTAAFAPPVARPSPKRPLSAGGTSQPDQNFSKRPAVTSFDPVSGRESPARVASPKPPPEETSSNAPASATRRPSSGEALRRPSGFFAQRKSMGGLSASQSQKSEPPQKKTDAGPEPGRASIGGSAELYPDLNAAFELNTQQTRAEQSTSLDEEDVRMPFRPVVQASPMKSPRTRSPARRVPIPPTPPAQDSYEQTQTSGSFVNAVEQTEQWRNGLPLEPLMEEDEGPPISIDQFFSMTGIRFMDELTVPRRSTIHPSQLNRRTSLSEEDNSLAEYIVALAVDLPQLELHASVAKDLQLGVQHIKDNYRQAEEEAAKCTPALFREYQEADEETKEELLHQLKVIKANNHGSARSQWYDWRLQWVQQLTATADEEFKSLEEDARKLEGIVKEAQTVLPSLREEHARVMKELEQEEAIAAEIESCDQEYLNELKGTIAEQSSTLETFRADVGEVKAKYDYLKEKLDQIEAEKKEANDAIREAKRINHISEGKVAALQGELAVLDALDLIHITEIRANLFEFVYDSRFRVTVPCKSYRTLISEATISRLKGALSKSKDHYPEFTEITLAVARQRLTALPAGTDMKRIVTSLGDFWSGCHELRKQLVFLSIKYPLTIEALPRTSDGLFSGMKATASVLLLQLNAKVYISYILENETLARWPRSLEDLKWEIKVAYGNVDQASYEDIKQSLQERLSQATPDDSHGCLLDACIAASEKYEDEAQQ